MKSCSWSRNRVCLKIDFKAIWPRNGHAASVGVKVDQVEVTILFKDLFEIWLEIVSWFICYQDQYFACVADERLKNVTDYFGIRQKQQKITKENLIKVCWKFDFWNFVLVNWKVWIFEVTENVTVGNNKYKKWFR